MYLVIVCKHLILYSKILIAPWSKNS